MWGRIADDCAVVTVDNTVWHTVGTGNIFIFDKARFDIHTFAVCRMIVYFFLILIEAVCHIAVVVAIGKAFGGEGIARFIFFAVEIQYLVTYI